MEIKLCKDCVHSGKYDDLPILYCYNPHLGVDLVDGTALAISCKLNRSYELGCKKEGKWFEPKPFKEKPIMFWKKIKGYFND